MMYVQECQQKTEKLDFLQISRLFIACPWSIYVQKIIDCTGGKKLMSADEMILGHP